MSGGKGGVGKSSVAAGLARQLRRRDLAVGLLDADLSGPSQPLLFDCPPLAGVDGRIVPSHTPEGILVVSSALLAREESALVWSGATATAAIESFTEPAVWDAVDVLIVDLPPGHGEIAVEVTRRLPGAVGVLVTTGSALAVAECRRAATFLQRMEVALVGMVDNMAYLHCEECGHDQSAFDADGASGLAAELATLVLARVPFGVDPSRGCSLEPVVEALTLRPARDRGA